MNAVPRLEINLQKIEHNARTLVERLLPKGINVTGITKGVLGSLPIIAALKKAGIKTFGDSRIENLEAISGEVDKNQLMLIRSPMLSQIERIVANSAGSLNTEKEVIKKLSHYSKIANKIHNIILMVELGDLREGIMPKDLMEVVEYTLNLPNLFLKGIGTNLACRSGVAPDKKNMAELSNLTDAIENKFCINLDIISGGNSANLPWAFSSEDTGRINDIRLGESIYLGCEPLNRQPIKDLFTDAIILVAEVIESKTKPSKPYGKLLQTAFGIVQPTQDKGSISQSILAIGIQDVDYRGLSPPPGIEIIGASSDHLVLEANLHVGSEVKFGLNYSAMVRAMTSPFVVKEYLNTTA